MTSIWVVFGITVLIAVYSGITFFFNLNSKAKQKKLTIKVLKRIIYTV